MAGVTANGFEKETFNTLLDRLETRARAVFGAPDLDVRDPKGALGATYLPMLEQIAELWELAEAVYNAPDPNRSTGQAFAVVGALRGVKRKAATIGTAEDGVDMTFSGAVAGTINRGDIRFNVDGQSNNIWINSNDITIPGAGTYEVASESELVGADKILQQGATINIIESPAELTGISISADAASGSDLEEESAWRSRAEAVIDSEQTALGAAVEEVDNVISATVIETAGEVQVIVYDNGAADDDEIAQAILDNKCQGVVTTGVQSGDAIDENGDTVTMNFDRADELNAFATINIKTNSSYSVAEVKAALQSAQPTRVGQEAVWSKLNSAVDGVAGVDDLDELFIGISASPTQEVNIVPAADEIVVFPDGNITVSTV